MKRELKIDSHKKQEGRVNVANKEKDRCKD